MLDKIEPELLRVMSERIARLGEDESGAYNYYAARVRVGKPLTEYEKNLFELLKNEPAVFHAGIGFGTLTVCLASVGVRCIGFEVDQRRWDGATEIANAIAPYDLRLGPYPAALKPEDDTKAATLVFTNVGAGWSDEEEAAVIATFPRFRQIILSLTTFGRVRHTPEERAELRSRLEASGHAVTDTSFPDATYSFVLVSPPAAPLSS